VEGKTLLIKHVNVAVFGAGPAGISAAWLCHLDGYEVLIVSPGQTRTVPALTETLPSSARYPLHTLGILEAFLDARFPRLSCVTSAWGTDVVTDRHAIFDALGAGWCIDRIRFDAFLSALTIHNAEIPVVSGRLRNVSYFQGAWALTLARPELKTFSADFVIDASGRSSAFSRRLGIPRRSVDRQICAHLQCKPNGRTAVRALVESSEHGWWYSAPAADGTLTVAYFTDADSTEQAWRTEDGWRRIVENTVHTREQIQTVLPGTPQVRSASAMCLSNCAGRAWLAIGDAAASYDPLASQGILNALNSAIAARDAMRRYFAGEAEALALYDYGQHLAFRRFIAQRKYFYSIERRWPESAFWSRRFDSGKSPTRWLVAH
jgi:flavin-dependent dehydrogenase